MSCIKTLNSFVFKFVLREEVIKVPAVNNGRSQASVHLPICIINLWRRCVQSVVNSVKVCQKKKTLTVLYSVSTSFPACIHSHGNIHSLVCAFVCIKLACWAVETARKKWPRDGTPGNEKCLACRISRGHFFLAFYLLSSSTDWANDGLLLVQLGCVSCKCGSLYRTSGLRISPNFGLTERFLILGALVFF